MTTTDEQQPPELWRQITVERASRVDFEISNYGRVRPMNSPHRIVATCGNGGNTMVKVHDHRGRRIECSVRKATQKAWGHPPLVFVDNEPKDKPVKQHISIPQEVRERLDAEWKQEQQTLRSAPTGAAVAAAPPAPKPVTPPSPKPVAPTPPPPPTPKPEPEEDAAEDVDDETASEGFTADEIAAEVWRRVRYKVRLHYEVSSLGRVSRRLVDGRRRLLRGNRRVNPDGTPGFTWVHLADTDPKAPIPKRIDEMVLDHFVGPKPDKHAVHYADGDRDNMRLSNLSWQHDPSRFAQEEHKRTPRPNARKPRAATVARKSPPAPVIVPEPSTTEEVTVNNNILSIKLKSGGTLSVSMEGNLFALNREDRELVSAIADLLQEYESEHGAG